MHRYYGGRPSFAASQRVLRLRFSAKDGGPSKTRTCDLLVRSQTLYPTELWAPRGKLQLYHHSVESGQAVSSRDLLRHAFGWPTIGAGTAAAVFFFVLAVRLNQPAFDVARWCAAII